jgi:hypothetical protein
MLLIGGGLAHPTSSTESRVSAQFTPVVEGRVLVGFAVPAENVEDVSLLPSRSRTKNVNALYLVPIAFRDALRARPT